MSRELTFWNDETIKLIKDNFIAVSVPTWVCRANSPEGAFLQAAGIQNRWVTSSGYMNCVSASGKMLGGRPCEEVLGEFAKLPDAERQPGAIEVQDLKPEELLIPSPPTGGLVLKVHARFLSRGDDGNLRPANVADFPLMPAKQDVSRVWQLFLEPNTEYMWLTQGEWQALVPSDPAKGQSHAVDSAIAERMARFHLTPQRATTSEGGIIDKRAVKSASLRLLVDDVTAEKIQFSLTGFVHWGSDYDPVKATSPNGPLGQGFETLLHGRLEFDRVKKSFTRFDIVAPGHAWGRWGDANGKSMYVERPGREPFGFAFELATGDSPTNRIPPGGNGSYVSERSGYFSVPK